MDIPSEGTPKCQESWELHDAVEVGGADLEERGDVAAFDQDPSYPGWPGWTMGYWWALPNGLLLSWPETFLGNMFSF